MASMVDCLNGIDTSKMTLSEIDTMLRDVFNVNCASDKSLAGLLRRINKGFIKKSTRKSDYESHYSIGMTPLELSIAAGSCSAAARSWIERHEIERVKIPTCGAAHLALHCKWGSYDNHKD